MFKVKKSCWNCHLSIGYRQEEIARTYREPGEPAMIEDCKSNIAANDWDNWTEDYENSNSKNELEEYIANKCPDYLPEYCTCRICGKEIKADSAIAVHDIYDCSITCSYTCATLMSIRVQKEIEEYM
jgi:hypothetical protein